jgi:hypothetical protein
MDAIEVLGRVLCTPPEGGDQDRSVVFPHIDLLERSPSLVEVDDVDDVIRLAERRRSRSELFRSPVEDSGPPASVSCEPCTFVAQDREEPRPQVPRWIVIPHEEHLDARIVERVLPVLLAEEAASKSTHVEVLACDERAAGRDVSRVGGGEQCGLVLTPARHRRNVRGSTPDASVTGCSRSS